MDPVPLKEFGSADEPVQKEGIERHPIAIHDTLIGRGEFGAVVRTEIGGGEHAGDHHEDARPPRRQHDSFEIRLELLRREGPERVVTAEFDEKVGRSVGQDPSDPSCSRGTRVPRHTRIDNRASETPAL